MNASTFEKLRACAHELACDVDTLRQYPTPGLHAIADRLAVIRIILLSLPELDAAEVRELLAPKDAPAAAGGV